MFIGGSARQRGKSTMGVDLLEAALNRGRRVLVCKRTGNLLYQRFGHLTSITPMREEPVDLWLDECATFERYEAEAAEFTDGMWQQLPSPATIATAKRMLDDNDEPQPPRAA